MPHAPPVPFSFIWSPALYFNQTSRGPSLINVLPSSVISSLLGPNISVSTPFSRVFENGVLTEIIKGPTTQFRTNNELPQSGQSAPWQLIITESLIRTLNAASSRICGPHNPAQTRLMESSMTDVYCSSWTLHIWRTWKMHNVLVKKKNQRKRSFGWPKRRWKHNVWHIKTRIMRASRGYTWLRTGTTGAKAVQLLGPYIEHNVTI